MFGRSCKKELFCKEQEGKRAFASLLLQLAKSLPNKRFSV
jgi:hypothetical protein